MAKAFISACSYTIQPVKICKLKYALKTLGSEAILTIELNKVARVLEEMGLAKREGQVLHMKQPPGQHASVVLDRIASVFECEGSRRARIEAAWTDLPVSENFCMQKFERVSSLFAKEEEGRPANSSEQ